MGFFNVEGLSKVELWCHIVTGLRSTPRGSCSLTTMFLANMHSAFRRTFRVLSDNCCHLLLLSGHLCFRCWRPFPCTFTTAWLVVNPDMILLVAFWDRCSTGASRSDSFKIEIFFTILEILILTILRNISLASTFSLCTSIATQDNVLYANLSSYLYQ